MSDSCFAAIHLLLRIMMGQLNHKQLFFHFLIVRGSKYFENGFSANKTKSFGHIYCKMGNFRENFIFANSVKNIFAMLKIHD